MGTEVLRLQDCLKASPAVFPRRKGCNYANSYSNPNPKPSRKPKVLSEKTNHMRRQAQPEPSTSRKWSSDDGGWAGMSSPVTILRRGVSLDSKKDKAARQSPRTPMTGKFDVYAGSAFAVSPEPSSLPLPSFSKKKTVCIDDSATKDLRRLLRLD